MARTRMVFAIAVTCAGISVVACRQATDATSTSPSVPNAPPQELSVTAVEPIAISATDCVAPGTIIDPGPAVRVKDGAGRPQPGVLVSFRISGSGGIAHTSATTDAEGTASAGFWRLGDAEGMNSVTASLASGQSVGFQALTQRSDTVGAVFDLVAVLGHPVPAYDGGALVTGAHFYLGTRTYEHRYDDATIWTAPKTVCTNAQYVMTPSGFQLYLAAGSYPASDFYAQRGGLFATATVTGDNLVSVHYEDPVDFDDETYVLVSGRLPGLWAMRRRRP